MWIRRPRYDLLLERLYGAQVTHAEDARRVAEMRTTLDWLRHRVNQLERERAALLLDHGIRLSVPELVADAPQPSSPADGLVSFEDMGDDAASAAHIPVVDPLTTPE